MDFGGTQSDVSHPRKTPEATLEEQEIAEPKLQHKWTEPVPVVEEKARKQLQQRSVVRCEAVQRIVFGHRQVKTDSTVAQQEAVEPVTGTTKRQSPPVLETDGSQISRLAQLENKVGRITDTETRRTPKNQEKTSVATTHKRIRYRHKESAITHNTKKSVGIIKKIVE